MQKELTTTKAVTDALGGYTALAGIVGSKPKAAENWKRFETFPPRYFLIMQSALNERGFTAPPSLWGMTASEMAS